MRIGELASQSGASVRSLRYYEEQGLLQAERTGGAQRMYSAEAVERVRLLRRLYGAGLNSATISSLMPCVDTPSEAVTVEAVEVMRREHLRIGDQIGELTATRAQLAYLIDAASAHLHEQADTAEPACV